MEVQSLIHFYMLLLFFSRWRILYLMFLYCFHNLCKRKVNNYQSINIYTSPLLSLLMHKHCWISHNWAQLRFVTKDRSSNIFYVPDPVSSQLGQNQQVDWQEWQAVNFLILDTDKRSQHETYNYRGSGLGRVLSIPQLSTFINSYFSTSQNLFSSEHSQIWLFKTLWILANW